MFGHYRGRIAPTPTGYLHLGHAATFLRAYQRCKENYGDLLYRVEDIDRDRCKDEYKQAALEDLQWLGITIDLGLDTEGNVSPEYIQSNRYNIYVTAWQELLRGGHIYPSPHSRKDVADALLAPHEDENEPIFPTALRQPTPSFSDWDLPGNTNWRFRVPEGRQITFKDLKKGTQTFTAGVDFGDFLVWRKDDCPSYELAVVADDISMKITEVVRGEDLLLSTARQLLLYEALGSTPPRFYHCPLIRDENGKRLAKRTNALALRTLRENGITPEEIRRQLGLEKTTE